MKLLKRHIIPILTAIALLAIFIPVRAQEAPKRYLVRAINIHGTEHLTPSIVRGTIGLEPGDSLYIPSDFIQSAISRLWSQKLYSDVQMGATIDGEELDLEVTIAERARVNYWRFEGINKSQQKDLLEALQLKRGSELSDYIIEKNKKLIRDYYHEKGFRNVTVEAQIANDAVLKQAVNVTFVIHRGKKVRVGEITFGGNHAFTDKRLRRTFKKTHQTSINFFRTTKFNPEEFKNDQVELIDFYNSKGYRNADVLSDSLYVINDKRIGIHVEVSEGNKYYIRNIAWLGNSIFETSMLEDLFGVEKGSVYDKKSMYKRLGLPPYAGPDDVSILSLYQDRGYLTSQIDPAETIIGADSIDLEIRIFEGKPFTVRNVGISGNSRVNDEVIRRELYTRPGELYNRSLLFQTIRTLGSMGHFAPEAIAPDIQLVPGSDDLVDINWPLQERPSDQFQIAGGFGAGTFMGSVGVTLTNLSMRNFFKKGAWRPYPMGQGQQLSLTAQSNGTFYKAISLGFTDPWMGGRKPNSFSVTAHYSDENNGYWALGKSDQHFRTTGLAVGLGKRLTWPDPYFTFYVEGAYERYMLRNWTNFVLRDGNANLFSVKLVLGRNSVDNPIYPRRGSDFSVSLQITPPYSLLDGKNYSDTKMSDQERYRWIEFHKWTAKGQWFLPLTPKGNLVLMLRAEMGYLGHYNRHKISPFERFEVVGDGMAGYNMYGTDIIALRGFGDGALDPVGSNHSVGYNKYTLELRYPVLMKGQTNIYVLGFAEGGNGFRSWEDFTPFRIKRSAGVGVRLFLPMIGMVGVDWGYGFDPAAGRVNPSGGHVHFTFGVQF